MYDACALGYLSNSSSPIGAPETHRGRAARSRQARVESERRQKRPNAAGLWRRLPAGDGWKWQRSEENESRFIGRSFPQTRERIVDLDTRLQVKTWHIETFLILFPPNKAWRDVHPDKAGESFSRNLQSSWVSPECGLIGMRTSHLAGWNTCCDMRLPNKKQQQQLQQQQQKSQHPVVGHGLIPSTYFHLCWEWTLCGGCGGSCSCSARDGSKHIIVQSTCYLVTSSLTAPVNPSDDLQETRRAQLKPIHPDDDDEVLYYIHPGL